ncbi:MAG: hypothetical protein A2Z25_07140 [Planctomycetes bacterium RBG_16_55_9]|nr:MAG: hypothetical protein A2Z25_07140 [Planctomycetes bacterium RBG_16_55_9]
MTDETMSFVERCRDFLHARWKTIGAAMESSEPVDPLLPDRADLRDSIVSCLTSPIKSYHYVLPTQVLSKCVDASLDSHCLQASYDEPGAFDARTVAHKIIVPFDQENHRVLGGSAEPYVNNPLRYPAVTDKFRNQQKNKVDWDRLVAVLDAVEQQNAPDFTEGVFDQILAEIYRLLADVQVLYPTPNRVSLAQTSRIIKEFTAARSGGDRIEVVCAALFRTIASEFGLFDEVRRQKVNVADVASGMGADIECRLKGQVILLVEVKDRSLTLTQVDAKLDVAKTKKISEILFLAEQGIAGAERIEVQERIKNEFAGGQNIYVSNFADFSSGILILLGEKGRVQLLSLVGEELDKAGSNITHRRAWAQVLRYI